jgi:hypothetical protein
VAPLNRIHGERYAVYWETEQGASSSG